MNTTGIFKVVIIICASFSLAACKCSRGVKPLVNFQVLPQQQTIVGSTIVLYCNATTIGVNSQGHFLSKEILEKLLIIIHDEKRNLKCTFKKDSAQSAHCNLTIRNVNHSHSKRYCCVATIEGGGAGCESKELVVYVKDCTQNKTNLITIKGILTKTNTIVVNWDYIVESCDKNIVVYWSKYGPVTRNSISIKLSNLHNRLYEITELEPNKCYWVGVAVETTKGISEILRSKELFKTSDQCNNDLPCHTNASCQNTKGSYICKCNSGYTGNGFVCSAVIPARRHSTEEKNISTTIVVIVTALACFLIICGIICILILRRKRRHSNAQTESIVGMENTAVQNLGVLFPETHVPEPKISLQSSEKIPFDNERQKTDSEYLIVLDEWEVPRDNLIITSKKLGAGQFGIVKRGTYKTSKDGKICDQTVAIKVLKENASDIDCSDFLSELRILKFVNVNFHPNILKLIGACTSETPSLIITEYCSNGNLKDLLENFRSLLNGKIVQDLFCESNLTDYHLLKMAADVACGMEHLASMKFVHRDLAARNILIGEDWKAKIADFGLARETKTVGEYIRTRRNLLPVKWTAIEALVEGKFSTASDVWSYGVLLWEISNIGGEPYKGISPYDIISHVGSGGRLGKPEHCSPYLYKIMNDCWKILPEKRPSFGSIYEILSSMLGQSEKLYINAEFMDGTKKNDREYERYTEEPGKIS